MFQEIPSSKGLALGANKGVEVQDAAMHRVQAHRLRSLHPRAHISAPPIPGPVKVVKLLHLSVPEFSHL